MQRTCPSLKLLGSTPSTGLILKQNALMGPNISSTVPILALFQRKTPRLNLGNLLISEHLTTKLFQALWTNVAKGTTQEGGPWSKPPLWAKPPLPPPLPPPMPLPLGAPLCPNPPLGAYVNCLPIKIISTVMDILLGQYCFFLFLNPVQQL